MKNNYRGLLRAERPTPSSVRARGKHIKSNTETHRAQRKHSFERGWENNMYGKKQKTHLYIYNFVVSAGKNVNNDIENCITQKTKTLKTRVVFFC